MSAQQEWTYQLLGDVAVVRAGTLVRISAAKPRLLLTLLLSRPNEVVPADVLIDELWSGSPPRSARTLLHGYVSTLRRVLEPDRPARAPAKVLCRRPPGYVLVCEPQDIDAIKFEDLVRKARKTFHHEDIAGARRLLEQALQLWRRPPFGALGDEPALSAYRTRLEQLYVSAVEDRVMLDLRDGHEATLVPELEDLVAQYPLRERLWAAFMLALYRQGRQADALDAYRRVSELLREELGADPGAELVGTHRAILRHDTEAVAPLSSPPRMTRPPRSATGLVGRQTLLAELHDAVSRHRLVTLIGPGGCGKTRLAQELTRSLEPAQAVAWVDLGPVGHEDAVAATVMNALGLVEQPGRHPLDTLVAQIGDRQLTVVLDTCEHQLAACRDLTNRLLRGCSGVRMIATSRTALQLPGEVRWPIPPLAVPAEDADLEAIVSVEAVGLFVARAADTQPGFALTEQTAADAAAICRRLEGLPLAIELAAAWVAVLGLPAIREQLADPLGFLTRGSPEVPDRQRTLRATIEWSYRLLDDDDREMFDRLSVFAGPFALDAALRVCGTSSASESDGTEATVATGVLDRLANLQAASLLTAVQHDDGTTQFRMLDTIRQFGYERLAAVGLAEPLRERHAQYIRDLARQAERGLRGPDLPAWLARLDDAHADVRAALTWSLSSGHVSLALDTAGALARFWMARACIAEGRRWLRQALAADDHGQPVARVRALLAASFLASLHYDLDDARETADEALTLVRLAGHAHGTAWALGMAALAASMAGNEEEALSYTREALDLSDVNDAPLIRGWTLNFMALGLQVAGRYEQQRDVLRESLQLCQEAGDPMGVEWALGYGGSANYALGRHGEARDMLLSSLEHSRRIGNLWGMARNLAAIALVADDPADRQRQMRQSLVTFGRLGDRAGVAFCLRAVAAWVDDRQAPHVVEALVDTANRIGSDVVHVPVLGHLAAVSARPDPVTADGSPGAESPPITVEEAVEVGLQALAGPVAG